MLGSSRPTVTARRSWPPRHDRGGRARESTPLDDELSFGAPTPAIIGAREKLWVAFPRASPLTLPVDSAGRPTHTRRMSVGRLSWSVDVARVDWIAAWAGAVARSPNPALPEGFKAYARVLHPAEDGVGRSVRWADVAAWSGVALGPDSLFCDIAVPRRAVTTEPPWSGQGPRAGALYLPDAEALAGVLGAFTATPTRCFFAVWQGYGWDGTVLARQHGPESRLPDPVPSRVRNGPRLHLPLGRECFVLEGAVEAALDTTLLHGDQTPTAWWPADRAWYVVTDPDLTWTYIGGSRDLVERLAGERGLRALGRGCWLVATSVGRRKRRHAAVGGGARRDPGRGGSGRPVAPTGHAAWVAFRWPGGAPSSSTARRRRPGGPMHRARPWFLDRPRLARPARTLCGRTAVGRCRTPRKGPRRCREPASDAWRAPPRRP
jgi:hypothetical protein